MSQITLVQKRAILSAVAAVAVHALVLGFWMLMIVWELPLFALEAPEPEPLPEPEVTVVFQQAAPLVPEPEKTEPQPEVEPEVPKPVVKEETKEVPKEVAEQKRRFARTSAEQAGKPDAPTDLLGERDTRAASEAAPTPGADPSLPSQDGSAPLYPGHVETVRRTYQDGSVGMDDTGQETETPQGATARKDNTAADDAPKVETPKPEETSSARPKNKHLPMGQQLPTHDDGEGRKAVDDEPKAEESPKEKPNQGADRDGAGGDAVQEPKKGGFSGFSKKTRITGSISRRGKSALNVKNSPLGRYQAKVSKAVELQWRRNCEQHRDHIVPGVISLRFYVDRNGKVSGVKFQEVIESNYIARGFTQRAVRQAKLPKMPRAVLKELRGEPLELIYNFYF